MGRTENRRREPSERGLCAEVPVESHGCWQCGEKIWLAAGIREHLAGPVAAGGKSTQRSRQHTSVYGELRLAKSLTSFKISS